jgi:hypothetical protein
MYYNVTLKAHMDLSNENLDTHTCTHTHYNISSHLNKKFALDAEHVKSTGLDVYAQLFLRPQVTPHRERSRSQL